MKKKGKKIKVRIGLPVQKGGPHGPKGGKKTYSRSAEKQKFRLERRNFKARTNSFGLIYF